ncbi:phosphoglycerol geranylgeranyltransferase [Yeosuana marina]|uniref:geranylgeranylglyceryl/heptaprenylglyceryl phosphate synthase n=1 Tax=Yeosuana marina TaxID=1565536 RepID=UPI001423188C|nr:geranylgeranylglyceryl/heptaprenylglyceryl phosphate synthase [Yeosuana marina]
MTTIYKNIQASIKNNEKLFAVLIDPDKIAFSTISSFIKKLSTSMATHIFVGGSTVKEHASHDLVIEIKKYTKIPVILFPGDIQQLTGKADALLFLSLLSGRNSEYLIGKQVKAVSKLRTMNLEVIPTGYILIENGKQTSVERVTRTKPISRNDIQNIVDTAKAGELLGMKLIYLEAGSGALKPITADIISAVKKELNIPLLVGGGIKNKKQLDDAYNSGADLVVVGTAFEEDESFLEELKKN